MGLDAESALELLNEAKSEGYETEPIPEDEEALIARATYFYEHAKKEFEEGNRENVIQSIIWIGDTGMKPLPDDKVKKTYPRRSSGGLSESDEREIENFPQEGQYVHRSDELATRENLPIPQHIEGDPDPMPRDLSTVVDKNIRRLSGEYNAYLARTTYLLGIASSDLAMAEHLLDAARAKALRSLDLVDPLNDKKQKLAKVIDSEILADPEVTALTDDVAKHQQRVIMLKSLKEIYSSNVDRLSREWTMRQNEWEKSR